VRALLASVALSLSLTAASAPAAIWPSAAERVTQELGSPDPAVRRAAAARIGELPSAAARKLADRALVDPDVEVRLRVVPIALELSLAGVADKVLPWLAESEPRLRLAAAEALRRQPSARAVAQLGRALADSDPAVRAAAARALGASENPEAVLPLLGRLDDTVPEVRQEVVLALARLGDARAVVPLIGKVEDARPSVRAAVARALGELGDSRSVGALVLSLRDAEDDVKIGALAALGRIGDPASGPSIVAVLESRPAPPVRAQALRALGRLGTPEALNVLLAELSHDEQGREREPVLQALERAGASAIELVRACLRGPAQGDRNNGCALAASASRDPKSAPLIVAAIERGAVSPAVGLAALGRLGERQVVPAVLEYLQDGDPEVRVAARRAAYELLDPQQPDGRAVDPIARALSLPRLNRSERTELMSLLGRTGSPRAAQTLLPLAKGATNPQLRAAALDALGAIGPAGQDAVLLEALSDESPAVRRDAALALRRVASPALAPELVSRLERASEQDRRALALALGGALAETRDEKLLGRVARLLAASRDGERDELIEALARSSSPAAVAALKRLCEPGSSAADRAKVAESLARTAAGLPLLRALARDVDSAVRANAVWALGSAGEAKDAEVLRRALTDRDIAVAGNAGPALGRLAARGKVAPGAPLCAALRDARGYVRAGALAGLRLGALRCDPVLERRLLAQDPVEAVRQAAARMIAAAKSEPLDQRALSRCVSEDPSSDVAKVCESPALVSGAASEALTVFVVPAGESAPVPRAPFALVLADGSVRLGLTDRRGALFEPAAPRGGVSLTVPAPLAR
jgi:cellulose synthase operon protein C